MIAINVSEEIGRIESELEMRKQNLREDAVQIRQKINETKAELNPTILVSQRSYFVLGAALSAGLQLDIFLTGAKLKQSRSPVRCYNILPNRPRASL